MGNMETECGRQKPKFSNCLWLLPSSSGETSNTTTRTRVGGMTNGTTLNSQETWLEMSLVNSNIVTDFFAPKIGFKAASALITVFFFSSWSLFFLMYSQTFLVISVRGTGFAPTMAANASSGWTGFMKAEFAFLAAGFEGDFAGALAPVLDLDVAILMGNSVALAR